LLGIGDGRTHGRSQRQAAEAAGQRGPGGGSPGHGDGNHPIGRDPGHAFPRQFAERQLLGGGAAGVEAIESAFGPHQGEGIATDAVGGRFHDRQACGGRDGGVNGVPALFHHLQAGLGGERL